MPVTYVCAATFDDYAHDTQGHLYIYTTWHLFRREYGLGEIEYDSLPAQVYRYNPHDSSLVRLMNPELDEILRRWPGAFPMRWYELGRYYEVGAQLGPASHGWVNGRYRVFLHYTPDTTYDAVFANARPSVIDSVTGETFAINSKYIAGGSPRRVDVLARISPDDRFVSYIDKDSALPALCDIRTRRCEILIDSAAVAWRDPNLAVMPASIHRHFRVESIRYPQLGLYPPNEWTDISTYPMKYDLSPGFF